jgi:hypothetical protein
MPTSPDYVRAVRRPGRNGGRRCEDCALSHVRKTAFRNKRQWPLLLTLVRRPPLYGDRCIIATPLQAGILKPSTDADNRGTTPFRQNSRRSGHPTVGKRPFKLVILRSEVFPRGQAKGTFEKNLRPMKFLLLFLIAALFAGTAISSGEAKDVSSPKEFWWYWDRPAEQLPAPAPGVGAAVLVTHVIFSGQGYAVQPRRSPLRLPYGVATMPVIHVEVDPARPFAANAAQSDALRAAVLDATRRGSSTWVQLDFEARRSQREFWRTAVHSIKAALPSGVRLSVTALASWCYGDRWIGDAPVDEIVPMYFRLKQARHDYIVRSAAGVSEPLCASAYGVADDEPAWSVALPGRRYVFLGQRGRPIADPQQSSLP